MRSGFPAPPTGQAGVLLRPPRVDTAAVRTYDVPMRNITLSVDDQLLEQARRAADRRGKSLNALIREYLEELAGARRGADAAERLQALWAEGRGNSGGQKISRDTLYEGRV